MPDLFDFRSPDALRAWRQRWRDELQHNVLPWWRREIFDAEGRVLAGRGNDGAELPGPRSAVLGTRLLWTFASAEARLGEAPSPPLDWAHAWLQDRLTDPEHGGVFWHVGADGEPLDAHKQVYAQAFAIYALCAVRDARPALRHVALKQALSLFDLLQAHAFDPVDGGCWEGFTRDWQPMADSRLSAKEPAAAKTMNTMLHVLEALTELLRQHRSPAVEARLRELLGLFVERIWLPQQRCFGLFFSRDWQVLTEQVSWGHDIETAWLLVRAAEVLRDDRLLQITRDLAMQTADAVLAAGIAPDGSVLCEGDFQGRVTDAHRHWWCQAEAVVGFWDAWQLGRDPRHAEAAWRAWRYIDLYLIDRQGGDWFKTLDADGRLMLATPKAGPWECPYHHVRAGLEMIERLPA